MIKEKGEKDDALDIATAQINSLEEIKNASKARINKYGATLKSLIKEKENNAENKTSDKEKELKDVIKEKNKKPEEIGQ